MSFWTNLFSGIGYTKMGGTVIRDDGKAFYKTNVSIAAIAVKKDTHLVVVEKSTLSHTKIWTKIGKRICCVMS